MPAYFDSSVLLSLVVGDEHAQRARAIWHEELERVSSTLLHVECMTVLRRAVSEENRREAEQRLSTALEEVTLKPVDRDVAILARDTKELGGCRALDAAHLATALFFGEAADARLRVCTFDARMARVAAQLGLQTWPA